MTELVIRAYRESDEGAVVELWRECGLVVPWNDPKKDICRKLSIRRVMVLVGSIGSKLVATVMAGYDRHRGWINYLAVATGSQERGFGRRMMDEAEARMRELGCLKINLQVRNSNTAVIELYRAIGYSVDEVGSMGKRLEADNRGQRDGRPKTYS